MFRVIGCISEQHEPWLVVVAAILCAFGCFTTLSVLARARAGKNGRVDQRWLAVAATTGGASIWTTHFVAMLAYHPGFVVGYDVPLTFLSIAFAVSLTWMSFAVALQRNALAGGVLFGVAVGATHYTGMRALSAPAQFHWDDRYVAASIVIGVLLGVAAMRMFTRRPGLPGRLTAGLLMTLAIAGLHFTAMSALTLQLDPLVPVASDNGV